MNKYNHLKIDNPLLNIVLLQPEIPPNTGTIGRLCAGISSTLHLVGPLGFSVNDKMLRRAGLDYWPSIDVRYYNNNDEFFSKYNINSMFFTSRFAENLYHEPNYQRGQFIVFGSETKGIDKDILYKNKERCIRIPTSPKIRSLNIAVACGIICFEALRKAELLNEMGE